MVSVDYRDSKNFLDCKKRIIKENWSFFFGGVGFLMVQSGWNEQENSYIANYSIKEINSVVNIWSILRCFSSTQCILHNLKCIKVVNIVKPVLKGHPWDKEIWNQHQGEVQDGEISDTRG